MKALKLCIAAVFFLSTSALDAQQKQMRGKIERVLDKSNSTVGLRVTDFQDNIELARSGVETGDVLVEMCGYKLAGGADFLKADAELRNLNKSCVIKILRNDQAVSVTVKP